MGVYVSEGVPVSDSVGMEVNEDADPVGVVAIDGEAQIVVREGIDTAAAGVQTEPR